MPNTDPSSPGGDHLTTYDTGYHRAGDTTTTSSGAQMYWDPSINNWRFTETTTSPTTGVSSTTTPQNSAIRAQTERTLQLLRGTGQQGVQQGMQGLRQNLAQRGLMDSGSLGAGASRIGQNYSNLMAQGTMNAANNETDKILGLNEAEANRQQQIKMAGINDAYQRSLLELQARLARENQPSGMQQFMGGLGQGVASALPYLPKALGWV